MEPPFDSDAWTEHLFHTYDRRYGYEEREDTAFDAWQTEFRAALRETLGFSAIEDAGDCALDPHRVDAVETPDGERQTWIAHTEPEFRLPFHLLLPEQGEPPYPVVFTLHGHCSQGKDLPVGNVDEETREGAIDEQRRDFAAQAARRGYAAIAPDMRGMGALADAEDGRACQPMQLRAQLFDRSLTGERVWDVVRLLDFVEDRPDLDADRVAVTGHSGGGTVTLFAAAVDERFSVAAPCAYFCTFEDSIGSISHCACNYVPGVRRLGEMADVAGLIAPRPFVATNGAEDTIFPIEGTERAFDELRRIYAGADAADRCELYVGQGGHRYYPDGVWPFVERHLP